jgi:uncharacterized protein YbbK (DUF523 family)
LNIPSKTKILISACLLGQKVRFDGKIKTYDVALLEDYDLISCCPEVDGGLPTPRMPSEIQSDGSILNSENVDVSEAFNKGAQKALDTAIFYNIKVAILKSKSPSCSNRLVYDGSFSGTLTKGLGITVELLEQNGIKVFDENQIEEALIFLSRL